MDCTVIAQSIRLSHLAEVQAEVQAEKGLYAAATALGLQSSPVESHRNFVGTSHLCGALS